MKKVVAASGAIAAVGYKVIKEVVKSSKNVYKNLQELE